MFSTPAYASDWYVDNSVGSSGDGSSGSPWQNLSDIQWGTSCPESKVCPGDTVNISGGAVSQTYNEGLTIGTSGTAGNIITIKVWDTAGKNGKVIITNTSGYGIVQYKSYITISGNIGGNRNIQITGCNKSGIDFGANTQNAVVEYLEIDNNGTAGTSGADDGITFNFSSSNHASTKLEIRYCLIHDNWQDGIHGNGSVDSEYDQILIHHNELYNTYDDGIETGANSISIYNNIVHGIISTPAKGAGHPDGLVIMGSYGKIYNNLLYDFYDPLVVGNSNSMIYYNPGTDAVGETRCCIRIYNNLGYLSTSSARTGDVLRGMEMSFQRQSVGSTYSSITDILVANNTFVNMDLNGLSFYLTAANLEIGATVSTIYFLNNIVHNCSRLSGTTNSIELGGALSGSWTIGGYGSGKSIEFDYNVVSPGTQGQSGVSVKNTVYTYANFRAANTDPIFLPQANITSGTSDPLLDSNYKLTITSPAKDIGVSLLSYFTTDILGIIRPQGSAWDIGCFEYTGGFPCTQGTCSGYFQ